MTRDARGIRLALCSDTYAPQLNGVARTLERLVGAVRARGGEVRVISATDPAAADDDGVRRFASASFWAYPQLRLALPSRHAMVRELARFRPTVVHAATPFGIGLAARAAARTLGVPFVTSYHTSFNEYARFYRLGALAAPGWSFLRWFHDSGRRTWVPTRAVRDELRMRDFQRLGVWGRGVDRTRFAPRFRSDTLRAALGAGPDDVLVACVGRVALEKGMDVLARAMHEARAMAGERRIVFAVAGDGPYLEACRAGAPRDATFTGALSGDALATFYASADLFVFPSATDTFGNVLLEAMASGLPILAVESGPTRELLATGAGVMVPAGDARELARGIRALADDAGHRARLVAAGYVFARRCSWDAVFDELVDEYHELGGTAARTPEAWAATA